MPHGLPILPTTVVGRYAHPSWFYAAKELMEADRFGPVDITWSAMNCDGRPRARTEMTRREMRGWRP